VHKEYAYIWITTFLKQRCIQFFVILVDHTMDFMFYICNIGQILWCIKQIYIDCTRSSLYVCAWRAYQRFSWLGYCYRGCPLELFNLYNSFGFLNYVICAGILGFFYLVNSVRWLNILYFGAFNHWMINNFTNIIDGRTYLGSLIRMGRVLAIPRFIWVKSHWIPRNQIQ